MAKRVSAAEAKARLSALSAEVAYGGQHVIIERRGTPLVALVSVSELELLEQGRGDLGAAPGSSRPRRRLARGEGRRPGIHDRGYLCRSG